MNLLKLDQLLGLCVASLGAIGAFGFAAAGSASAAILFLPISHKFPYHLTGQGSGSTLETTSGRNVTSTEAHVSVSISDKTLVTAQFEFLKAKGQGVAPCSNVNGPSTEIIVMALTGHLGLADPGFVPAVLLLVPSGFKFTCELLGVKETFLVRGQLIGRITSPKVGEDTEAMTLDFKAPTKGRQEFTTFLLGFETLTEQFEETSPNEGSFEQTSQTSGPITVNATAGEGKFLLLLP